MRRVFRPDHPDLPPFLARFTSELYAGKRIDELVGKNESASVRRRECRVNPLVPTDPIPGAKQLLLTGTQSLRKFYQMVGEAEASPPTNSLQHVRRQLTGAST